MWRYIENTCILLLGERSKPAKKNLKVKIFNLQYDAMGYTTYSFYHLHKNVPFRNGRNTSRLSNVWKENFWYLRYMYITCHVPNCFKKFQWNIVFILWAKNVQFFQIYELYGLIDFICLFFKSHPQNNKDPHCLLGWLFFFSKMWGNSVWAGRCLNSS